MSLSFSEAVILGAAFGLGWGLMGAAIELIRKAIGTLR
jgi:hypothetical protein